MADLLHAAAGQNVGRTLGSRLPRLPRSDSTPSVDRPTQGRGMTRLAQRVARNHPGVVLAALLWALWAAGHAQVAVVAGVALVAARALVRRRERR